MNFERNGQNVCYFSANICLQKKKVRSPIWYFFYSPSVKLLENNKLEEKGVGKKPYKKYAKTIFTWNFNVIEERNKVKIRIICLLLKMCL